MLRMGCFLNFPAIIRLQAACGLARLAVATLQYKSFDLQQCPPPEHPWNTRE